MFFPVGKVPIFIPPPPPVFPKRDSEEEPDDKSKRAKISKKKSANLPTSTDPTVMIAFSLLLLFVAGVILWVVLSVASVRWSFSIIVFTVIVGLICLGMIAFAVYGITLAIKEMRNKPAKKTKTSK